MTGAAEKREQSSRLSPSSHDNGTSSVRAGKRKAAQSDILDDFSNEPKTRRLHGTRIMEALLSAQDVQSEFKRGCTVAVERKEEVDPSSLNLPLSKADGTAIAKAQAAELDKLRTTVKRMHEKAKDTALEYQDRYSKLKKDHQELKDYILLLHEEKKDLHAQLSVKEDAHRREIAGFEVMIKKQIHAYDDDDDLEETRCLVLLRKAATLAPIGFEETAKATFANCLEQSREERRATMPRPKAESWF